MLDYRIFPSSTGRTNPSVRLLVWLHGLMGSNKYIGHIVESVPKDVVVVAPNGTIELRHGYAWFWNEGEDRVRMHLLERSLSELDVLIRDVVKTMGVNGFSVKETIIGGFSQGGTLGTTFPLYYPNSVDRSASFGGYIPDGVPVTSNIKNVKFGWWHGEADADNWYYLALRGKKKLEQARADLDFRSYKGVGHTITKEMWSDFLSWLDS